MWLSLRLVADAVLMLNSRAGDYISAGFRGESELWERRREVRGAAPTTGNSSSAWQPSQECDSKGVVVAASNLKVLGREETDPPQDFLPHRLEC